MFARELAALGAAAAADRFFAKLPYSSVETTAIDTTGRDASLNIPVHVVTCDDMR